MTRTTSPSIAYPSGLSLALFCTAVLPIGAACKGRGHKATPAHPPVLEFLLPQGKKRATLLVERTKIHKGTTRKMPPRTIDITRNIQGVVYRIRERIDSTTWRLAAQLFIDARSDGAWIRAQFGLGGRRVGARTSRLVFPWPPKPGSSHRVRYAIADGRKATGTVTVVRYGFSRALAGKKYQPCLEVREVLSFDRGGGIDLRSVFCVGFGRVEIESKLRRRSKGLRTTIDRSTGLAPPSP